MQSPLHSQRKLRTSAYQWQASWTNAAAPLVAANGFTGTTTKQVAKAAGTREALLFRLLRDNFGLRKHRTHKDVVAKCVPLFRGVLARPLPES